MVQPPPGRSLSQVRPVRKAYEQVADQLRELIIGGEILPGHRLPNEAALSVQFGVSRATVREALRVLTTQNLVRTAKGATGGSFVIQPTADHISDFLSSNIALLSQTETVSLDEFLELRELLEVPAARLAARRHDADGIERIRAAIPGDTHDLGTQEQFIYNKDFHSQLVRCSGNTLLSIAAQPIFSVLQTNLSRSNLGRRFLDQVNADHSAIADAVAAATRRPQPPRCTVIWRSFALPTSEPGDSATVAFAVAEGLSLRRAVPARREACIRRRTHINA
jgi:GntR family transcriptional repressor for pyruvate dehydrogenase complex